MFHGQYKETDVLKHQSNTFLRAAMIFPNSYPSLKTVSVEVRKVQVFTVCLQSYQRQPNPHPKKHLNVEYICFGLVNLGPCSFSS